MFDIVNSPRVLLSNPYNILKDVARFKFHYYIYIITWLEQINVRLVCVIGIT